MSSVLDFSATFRLQSKGSRCGLDVAIKGCNAAFDMLYIRERISVSVGSQVNPLAKW